MRDFWASGVEREKGRIAGKISKISFFSPGRGEEAARAVQNGTVQFFFFIFFHFLKKRKTKFRSDPKLGYNEETEEKKRR
jgi:hypothetical protein